MEFSPVAIIQHYLQEWFLKFRWQVIFLYVRVLICILSCMVMRLLVNIQVESYRHQRK